MKKANFTKVNKVVTYSTGFPQKKVLSSDEVSLIYTKVEIWPFSSLFFLLHFNAFNQGNLKQTKFSVKIPSNESQLC